jgi:hypothetical protein
MAIVLSGILLAFILGFFIDYQIEKHTRNGRLASQVLHLGIETNMTDAQIAHTIGDDPFRVLRRSVRMEYAVQLSVGLIVGIFVACFERRIPGRMMALTLAPYTLWCYYEHLPFTRALPPKAAAFAVAKDFGLSAAYLALAILVSVVVARLFSRGTGKTMTGAASASIATV